MKPLRSSLAVVLAAVLLTATAAADDELLTVAEKSDFTATSRNAEVIEFARELVARSNNVRLTWLGRSATGNPIPLLILGRPAPASPAELIGDSRLRVYIQANIHAGEIEGKAATLMLARDILLTDKYPGLLDKLVILIVPDLNTEGNDHISPEHRRYQGGPEKGVGLRHTDQSFDINRDWMKLETPEARSVVKLLNRWDPALIVDCHTTDGSIHREPTTYAPPYNPNTDADVMAYNVNVLLPAADARLKEVHGYESIPYGNFMDRTDPGKGWITFGHQPRYTTNYAGLRNRLSILIETYAYADFRTRVLSNYGFLESILHQCAADADNIARIIKQADLRADARATRLDPELDRLANSVELKPLPEPIDILSYEFEFYTDANGRQRMRPTEKEVTYTLPYFGRFEPTGWVPMAAAYILPAGAVDIVGKLREHGITVERLTRDTELTVAKFNLEGFESADGIYQGHRSTTVKGTWEEVVQTLPAGSFVIRTGQPLGMLAAYLLEPESDDGLVYWNFFDRYLTRQWGRGYGEFPLRKLMQPTPLPTEISER